MSRTSVDHSVLNIVHVGDKLRMTKKFAQRVSIPTFARGVPQSRVTQPTRLGVQCAVQPVPCRGQLKMFILTSAGSCLASCAAVCACQACQGVTREVLRKSARLAYCALFTTAMVLAWVLRDFAKPLIQKIPCMHPEQQSSRLGKMHHLMAFFLFRDCAPGNWGN